MFWKIFNPWRYNFKGTWRFKAFWAIRFLALVIPIMVILAAIGLLTDKDTSGGWGAFAILYAPFSLFVSYVWAVEDFYW